MRLGHPSTKVLQTLHDNRKINISKWTKIPKICASCQLGKSCKIPFSPSNKISVVPLHKIHCDLWGPAPINSNQNFKFYALFIDDHIRFSWLFPLQRKADFFDCFIRFQKQVETQFERKIKVFQCDEGGEFSSNAFIKHLDDCGIIGILQKQP